MSPGPGRPPHWYLQLESGSDTGLAHGSGGYVHRVASASKLRVQSVNSASSGGSPQAARRPPLVRPRSQLSRQFPAIFAHSKIPETADDDNTPESFHDHGVNQFESIGRCFFFN